MTTATETKMGAEPHTLDANILAHLQSWTGESETVGDDITAAPVRGLAATLDRDDPAPLPGTVLPHLWHWLYFCRSTVRATSDLMVTPVAAVFYHPCRCRAACGPVAGCNGCRTIRYGLAMPCGAPRALHLSNIGRAAPAT